MSTHLPPDDRNPRDGKAPDEAESVHSGGFMEMHQSGDPASKAAGYEIADANVRDTAIFLVIMAATLVVIFVVAFGIGKLIFKELGHQDGPTTKWTLLSGAKPGNFESDPKIQQQQLRQMVERFPTPRLQTDNGAMDVARMHAREDILLNHYSWVDMQKQTVRIPITRAMQLVAQSGLPVQGQAATGKPTQTAEEKPMFGDGTHAVTAPLTDGFARTAPELQMIYTREQRMETGEYRNTQEQTPAAK